MRRIIEQLVDDLDGSDAQTSIDFELDGTRYTIDLNGKNAEKMRSALAPYIAAGQRLGRVSASGKVMFRQRTASGGAAPAQTYTEQLRERQAYNAAVREWAHAQGMELSDRGRISQQIVDAYENRDHIASVPTQANVQANVAKLTPQSPAVPPVQFSPASANGGRTARKTTAAPVRKRTAVRR